MARARTADQTTVTPVLRDDGTVYFAYAGKPISERLCEWTLGALWFLVLAVIVTTMLTH